MWLLASFFLISLIQFVSSEDINGQRNDIIPDEPLEIPEGYFCYLTMSELMFVDRMQQVAPSATRVGAARLSVSYHLLNPLAKYLRVVLHLGWIRGPNSDLKKFNFVIKRANLGGGERDS